MSDVIKSLCVTLGINRTQTTEGNGQVERFNQTLEAMLAKVVAGHQRDWDEHIQNVIELLFIIPQDTPLSWLCLVAHQPCQLM